MFVIKRTAYDTAVAIGRREASGPGCALPPQGAVEVRDAFFSAIVHDLAQPLTVVRGSVQLLQRRLADGACLSAADLSEELSLIASSTEGMVEMVAELLDVARLQAGQALELNRQSTDLAAIVRELVRAQQGQADRHVLRLELGEMPELVGQWDATRLRRMIGNLLSNAVKYSPAGGEVLVRLGLDDPGGPSGAWAVLQVQDHGVGIPTADLARVVEYFQRGSNVVEQIHGTGIGLATARRIAHAHGGALALASQEGAGTTVTVRLPRGPLASEPPSAPQ